MRKLPSVNRRNEVEHVATCPLAAAMTVLGGRWKPMIVWYVAHGLDRWASLRAAIAGVSDKMLWQHLRELERDGLLIRVVEGRRVRYALTALGEGLRGPLAAMEAWSRDGRVGERCSVPPQRTRRWTLGTSLAQTCEGRRRGPDWR